MAVSSRHIQIPRGSLRHRSHSFAPRHRAGLHRPGDSCIPLHGGGCGRRRHPVRAVSHLRLTGAVRRRSRRLGRPPGVSARQSRRHRDRRKPRRRPGARRRGRKSRRPILRGPGPRRRPHSRRFADAPGDREVPHLRPARCTGLRPDFRRRCGRQCGRPYNGERKLILTKELAASAYRTLDPQSLLALVAQLSDVRALLGAEPEDWRVREVGDGNLNLVFIVEGPDGSVCVKQALPYVRAAGPAWPQSAERIFFEQSYYKAVAPDVGGPVPHIYHYDAELYCLVMERLSPHIILRHGLIAGHRYPTIARDIAEYVARACFFTSDFAWPFERK